jgi:hypothetical protein
MAGLTKQLEGFKRRDNTLLRVAKDYAPDRIEVEIGDSKQPDFKPQFKIMRWDNEVNFSMRAVEDPTATVDVADGVVKYITKDYEVYQYEKPEVSEDGGFEFEWVLPSKPKSNVLTATIQTKELDFFYQPALTEEEIEQGSQRPDNVVGSYAVYHKSKRDNIVGGKEYKTGKAFHIYRPEAVDATGARTWCELNVDVDAGVLTVTVPQKFLNKAVYPVVVDPTFGYTSAGSSWFVYNGYYEDQGALGLFALSEAGDVSKLSAYTKRSSTTGYSKGFVYTDSGGTPTTYKTASSGVSITSSTGAWKDHTLTTSLTAASYWLGLAGRYSYPSSNTVSVAYDSGGTGGGYYTDGIYADPSTFYSWAFVGNSNKYSIYATYTAVSSGYTLTASHGTYTLTGNSVNLTVARKLTAEQGTYTLTGQSVNFAKGYRLTAESGTYTLTGQGVTLTKTSAREMTAESGSYALTGQSAILTTGRKLTAESGSYTVTGQDATLRTDRTVTAESGTYSLTGSPVGLTTQRTLTAESGTYALTGQSVDLTTARTLVAESGTYTFTGQDVSFARNYMLGADSGAYTITGNDATLTATRIIVAESGAYTLTGQDVTLTTGTEEVTCGLAQENGGAILLENGDKLLMESCPLIAYVLEAGNGTYTLTGNDVGFAIGRTLTAEAGTYTLTGNDVDMTRTRTLVADAGTYTITGADVALCASVTTAWTPANKNTSAWNTKSKTSASWTSANKNSSSWSSDKTKRKNVCV